MDCCVALCACMSTGGQCSSYHCRDDDDDDDDDIAPGATWKADDDITPDARCLLAGAVFAQMQLKIAAAARQHPRQG
jgi:hypothetical protein